MTELVIYYIPLKAWEAQQEGFLDLLSERERKRAEAFVYPELTSRYITAHGALRELLGKAVGQKPGALQFERGPHEKPSLVNVVRYISFGGP